MLYERTWRKRVILSFVGLIVWMMNFAAILLFTSNYPQNSTAIALVLGSAFLILIYYFVDKRIMNLDWSLNERQIIAMKLLLWLFYPLFAFNTFIAIQPLGIDYFMESRTPLIMRIGVYGTIILIISLGVLFNRWHMAFNALEHKVNQSNQPYLLNESIVRYRSGIFYEIPDPR